MDTYKEECRDMGLLLDRCVVMNVRHVRDNMCIDKCVDMRVDLSIPERARKIVGIGGKGLPSDLPWHHEAVLVSLSSARYWSR